MQRKSLSWCHSYKNNDAVEDTVGGENQRSVTRDAKLGIAGMLSCSLVTMLETFPFLDKFLFHLWKALIFYIFT